VFIELARALELEPAQLLEMLVGRFRASSHPDTTDGIVAPVVRC
jgi:hypothetical protein